MSEIQRPPSDHSSNDASAGISNLKCLLWLGSGDKNSLILTAWQGSFPYLTGAGPMGSASATLYLVGTTASLGVQETAIRQASPNFEEDLADIDRTILALARSIAGFTTAVATAGSVMAFVRTGDTIEMLPSLVTAGSLIMSELRRMRAERKAAELIKRGTTDHDETTGETSATQNAD